tara:strand:+ start:570 stop:1061 length:492 start_codon:yes stop_codon:yes gene_type:complete
MAFKMKGFPYGKQYKRAVDTGVKTDIHKNIVKHDALEQVGKDASTILGGIATSIIEKTKESALQQNDNITTHKEERKIKKGWSDSRKEKHKETEKGMKELGIKKVKRKYRDLRYPYQDDKKIKIIKRDIAELEEKAIHAGKVNKKRILNKIEKLKAKLPKRAQ